jgi:hypothetical protein
MRRKGGGRGEWGRGAALPRAPCRCRSGLEPPSRTIDLGASLGRGNGRSRARPGLRSGGGGGGRRLAHACHRAPCPPHQRRRGPAPRAAGWAPGARKHSLGPQLPLWRPRRGGSLRGRPASAGALAAKTADSVPKRPRRRRRAGSAATRQQPGAVIATTFSAFAARERLVAGKRRVGGFPFFQAGPAPPPPLSAHFLWPVY